MSGVQAGEIRLELIPNEWKLTPLRDKRPYLEGWTVNPCRKADIERELAAGSCTAVGLIPGPQSNVLGLIWIDVDGLSVYDLIKEKSGLDPQEALPHTLTICSGREGRERKLYKVPHQHWPLLQRNKYKFVTDVAGEALEILWGNSQGVLMGAHPDTAGYFTPPYEGFEHAENLPDVPEWVLKICRERDKKKGTKSEFTRMVGPGFAVNQEIPLERRIQEITEALWKVHSERPEKVNIYDDWIGVGQMLHSLDESLLDVWCKWSSFGDTYDEDECVRKWASFTKREEGRTANSIFKEAYDLGWKGPNLNDEAQPHEISDATIDLFLEQETDKMLEGEPLHPVLEAIAPARKKPQRKQEPSKKANATKSQSFLTKQIVAYLEDNVRWSARNEFYMYKEGLGIWAEMDKRDLWLDYVKPTFEAWLPEGWSLTTKDQVIKGLQDELKVLPLREPKDRLCFLNGVLDLKTHQLEPHKKDNCFISQIPFDYDPHNTDMTIPNWLDEIMDGDGGRVQILRAVLRSVILGSPGHQKFYELCGYGRTGKSSFAKLCECLVGRGAVAVSSLRAMESKNFEAGKFPGKKLIMLPDESSWGGECSLLKALTGGDTLDAEYKHIGKTTQFTFHGQVICTCNSVIQSVDKTNGMERRRFHIPFNHVWRGQAKDAQPLFTLDYETGEIGGKFAPNMTGLVNWVIKLTEEEMKDLIENPERYSPVMKSSKSTAVRTANAIYDFVSSSIVYAPGHKIFVGQKKETDKRGEFAHSDTELYPAYLEWSYANDRKPVVRPNFYNLLKELVTSTLGNGMMAGKVDFPEQPSKHSRHGKRKMDWRVEGIALLNTAPGHRVQPEDELTIVEFVEQCEIDI